MSEEKKDRELARKHYKYDVENLSKGLEEGVRRKLEREEQEKQLLPAVDALKKRLTPDEFAAMKLVADEGCWDFALYHEHLILELARSSNIQPLVDAAKKRLTALEFAAMKLVAEGEGDVNGSGWEYALLHEHLILEQARFMGEA
jgi:hypothetical protein